MRPGSRSRGEAAVDWPAKGLWSRIRWLAAGWQTRRGLHRRGARRDATPPPTAERGSSLRSAADTASPSAVREALHRLDRGDGRLPLVVFEATDRSGHLVAAAACDPEDYDG
jgi:hypothetical protein